MHVPSSVVKHRSSPDYYRLLGWDVPFVWQREHWGPAEWAAAVADVRRLCDLHRARLLQERAATGLKRQQVQAPHESTSTSAPPAAPDGPTGEETTHAVLDTLLHQPDLARVLSRILRDALEGGA